MTDDITDTKHTETHCDRNYGNDSPGDDDNLILRQSNYVQIQLILLFHKIYMIESCSRRTKKSPPFIIETLVYLPFLPPFVKKKKKARISFHR